MRNLNSSIRSKILSKYLEEDTFKDKQKSPDINVLLNRVKLKQKTETKRKLYFSAAASTGLILFGLIIF